MNDINRKIDEFESKERKRNILNISAVIFVVVAFLMYWNMPPLGEKSDVTGVVDTLSAVPSDEGDILYMYVTLDSGTKVRVYIPKVSFYKQGERVKILKVEPLFCCSVRYKFRGYQ